METNTIFQAKEKRIMAKDYIKVQEEIKEVEIEETGETLGFKDGVKICCDAVKRSKAVKWIGAGLGAAALAAGTIFVVGKKNNSEDDDGITLLELLPESESND